MNDELVNLETIKQFLDNINTELEHYNNNNPDFRDQFAMAAITGILAGKWGHMPLSTPEAAFADFAYKIADAMIERREKYREIADAMIERREKYRV